ncbi:MAG TPA: UDP-N-acetylglucosamine--N-acetylmuramyl-(pentapeptide) pyrophosphoryl-undecaprenol N-acetylglucosamine transferase, partial [Candidatus Krumholzibacteria bacterium]|nr:UDP-N-acetylglucosamine--N-acetylmuramyl-(pentapeptide) pyrophosphoryl-undecaprenol N-acetylglucosamine transferase [Candidatus Krumholzibacteria bacterium]
MSDALRIIVAGGGTGGHVYPGIAVIERLEERWQTRALFVGVRGGVEEKILARAGRDYQALPGYGLRRATAARKLASPLVLLSGVMRAGKILSAFRPDVVLGTGGYASAAVVVASLARRTPRVLQEQNSVPGLVNRKLARYAHLMLLSYDESRRWLPATVPSLVVGNPLRRMPTPSRAQASAFFQLDPSRPTVLIVGGSRGAHSLNLAAADAAALLASERGVQFVILCGSTDRAEVERRTERVSGLVRVLDYLDEMHFAYAASDVAIARSGASSVFELALFGVPSIFVPYPYAADDHQESNAAPLVKAGGA